MTRYRAVIDADLCQGHSVCQAEAPQVFRVVDGDGPYPHAEPLVGPITDSLLAAAESAAAYCPNGAIRLVAAED